MAKKRVKNLYLNEYIETECTGGISGDYLPLSGGTVSGDVYLTSNLSVNNLLVVGQNTVFQENENIAIIGNSCQVGYYGYKILSVQNLDNNEAILSIDTSNGPIDDQIIGLKYSVDTTNAYSYVGVIDNIDHENSTLYVTNRFFVQPLVLNNKYMFFANRVDIGNTFANPVYSIATNYDNKVLADCAHAEGRGTRAIGSYAHTEGKNTMASWGAHAEGCANRSFGECSHTQGRVNIANGSYSTTIGSANITDSDAGTSLAAGYLSHVKHKCAFVWNGEKKYGYQGDPSKEYSYIGAGAWRLNNDLPVSDQNAMDYIDSDVVLSSMYESHGDGTFNINPENGLSGFYIGGKNLHTILSEYSQTPSNIKPLAGNTYTANSPLSSMIIDIIQALGGEYKN